MTHMQGTIVKSEKGLLLIVPTYCLAAAGVQLPHVDYETLRAALIDNCLR
jgi:hypothetical protein